jgi:hypothetical protein
MSVGAVLSGAASQAGRNAILEPWWGANAASTNPETRLGEQIADGGFIAGGSAVAVGGGLAFRSLQQARPSASLAHGLTGPVATGPSALKFGAIAVAGAGVLAAATGIKNLLASPAQTPPPVDPTPDPTPDPKPDPTPDPKPDPKPPIDPVPPNPPTGPSHPPRVRHEVRPGEYLDFIANCYDVSWQQLYWKNRDRIGSNPDVLRAGMMLRVPDQDQRVPAFAYSPSYDPNGVIPALTCPPNSPNAGDCNR